MIPGGLRPGFFLADSLQYARQLAMLPLCCIVNSELNALIRMHYAIN